MNDRIRCAVIGLGVGEQHAIGYARHPACTLAAICDRDTAKLADVGQRFPDAQRIIEAEAVLTDPEIDVVSICTYDDLHADQILLALAHGKHVFAEKPFCMVPAEAAAIAAALRAHPNLQFSTNTILRASARFRAMRDRVAAGACGELYAVEASYQYGRLEKIVHGWRGERPYYSVVHGGGVHVVDLLRWITGDEVVRVTAAGNQVASRGTQFRFRDYVHATLQFRSGIIGHVSADYGCVVPHFHPLAIYGTRGTLTHDRASGCCITSRDPHVAPERFDAPYPGVAKYDLLFDFIDAIRERRAPIVTAEDAFRTMAVCFAIEAAADRGTPVDVEAFSVPLLGSLVTRYDSGLIPA